MFFDCLKKRDGDEKEHRPKQRQNSRHDNLDANQCGTTENDEGETFDPGHGYAVLTNAGFKPRREAALV